MKIAIIDISGKVYQYDEALYESLVHDIAQSDSLVLAHPYACMHRNCKPLKLCSFVPERFRSSYRIWKRLLKLIEGIVNYLLVLKYIRTEKTDILHLQWLPFMEVCSWERYWLQLVRKRNPHIKIVLTMHNIYPHNSSERKKRTYKQRIMRVLPFIDAWIVHTHDAAERLQQEYGIRVNDIHIIHHGVFVPKTAIPERRRTDNKIRFLLFGQQSAYKGTDMLIEAVEQLPRNIKEQIEVQIMGQTEKTLYAAYAARAEQEHITWLNRYISESELLQALQDADVLVFPYRVITQSGALLLGLNFRKPLIVCNLPAFTETLGADYPKSLIVEPVDAKSLSETISRYVSHPVERSVFENCLTPILEQNSWHNATQKTYRLYHALLG